MDDEEEVIGIPEWVVTFGDMMSLLLTFFIMLVSMSEIKEEEQFQAMVESMRRQFGHDSASAFLIPGEQQPRNSNMPHIASHGRAKRKDSVQGGDKVKAPIGENPRVKSIRQGKNATLGAVVYFDRHSVELTEENRKQLQEILSQISGKPQRIEVRSHTTRFPIPSNLEAAGIFDRWDLAYARCRKVTEFLLENDISRDRIRMGVAAGNEPEYLGTDPDRIAKNSRVQIIMWDERVETTHEE